MDTKPSRRSLLSAMTVAPIAIAVPGIASASGSPTFAKTLDASDAARRRFENLPNNIEWDDPDLFEREEGLLNDAANTVEDATPTNWREFTRLFSHLTYAGRGGLDREQVIRLLDHARRLSKQEG